MTVEEIRCYWSKYRETWEVEWDRDPNGDIRVLLDEIDRLSRPRIVVVTTEVRGKPFREMMYVGPTEGIYLTPSIERHTGRLLELMISMPGEKETPSGRTEGSIRQEHLRRT